ncbi:MAG TPA: DUF2244 domain-containing protein [Rudaea sp.]|nr:DUF2244 domain-containing protein [Rudaea sp.]
MKSRMARKQRGKNVFFGVFLASSRIPATPDSRTLIGFRACPHSARSLSLASFAHAGSSMTAEVTGSLPGKAATVLVLPHRSLSRSGLAWFMAGQSFAVGIFASAAAWQGNVLAPVFAVLELCLLAYCLRRVWLASRHGQVITLTAERLEIVGARTEAPLRFHPYWVRVRLESPARRGWPSRLMLGSHGREVEIGSFLNEAERRQLAHELQQLLRPLKGSGGVSENLDAGDSE